MELLISLTSNPIRIWCHLGWILLSYGLKWIIQVIRFIQRFQKKSKITSTFVDISFNVWKCQFECKSIHRFRVNNTQIEATTLCYWPQKQGQIDFLLVNSLCVFVVDVFFLFLAHVSFDSFYGLYTFAQCLMRVHILIHCPSCSHSTNEKKKKKNVEQSSQSLRSYNWHNR